MSHLHYALFYTLYTSRINIPRTGFSLSTKLLYVSPLRFIVFHPQRIKHATTTGRVQQLHGTVVYRYPGPNSNHYIPPSTRNTPTTRPGVGQTLLPPERQAYVPCIQSPEISFYPPNMSHPMESNYHQPNASTASSAVLQRCRLHPDRSYRQANSKH